jgi:hypothetical protein
VVALGYVPTLIGNLRVSRYLERHHPEILTSSKPSLPPHHLRKAAPNHRKSPLSWVEAHDQRGHRAASRLQQYQ